MGVRDVLTGVLFDLDGTLLDIDIDGFFTDYFGALGPVVAEVIGGGIDPAIALRAVVEGTSAMVEAHPSRTNRAAFNARFSELTGVDLDLEEFALPFERFYAEVFPTLRGSIAPRDGAREVVKMALRLGLRVVIATNPIFPLSAIRERMRWAHVDDLDVALVTSYEIMHATKPLGAYFTETATLIGSTAAECMMVGDDRVLDMSAADIGMRTFYVGPDPVPASDYHGDLRDLAALLPRLVQSDG
jgi:FMN phosphatase YigB (HAD superfamily)